MRFAFVVLLARLSPGAVWYVDADAGGADDGTSWTNAFTDLQSALSAAASADEIWVAEGTYKPTGGSDRTISFALRAGVAVYGGFAGTESARDERDWVTNVTTLSGDIGVAADDTDNSYHVVVGADNATLDGLTVTGGMANGSYPDDQGAGMYNDWVTGLVVANCAFSGNTARYGGGGMYNDWYSSPATSNCSFSGNTASYGGGMYNVDSSPTVTSCTFSGNTADSLAGGGMLNFDSSPTVSGCTFSGNAAPDGGGMCNWYSSPSATSCTFSGNSAGSHGGGMCNYYESSPSVTNCTFWGNSAGRYGGGISNGASSVSVVNSILWSDSAPRGTEIYNAGLSTCIVSYSDVAQVGGFADAGGNINVDPLFADADGSDDVPGTPDDDLRLQAGSPCVDAADGDAAPAADIVGNARRDDPGAADAGTGSPSYADMGAYEFQGTTAGSWLAVWNPPAGAWLGTGTELEIQWLAWGDVADVSEVRIEFSRNAGADWELIAAPTPNDGSHAWTVTDGGQALPQQDCRVRVSDAADGVPGGTSAFSIFGGVWHVDADAPGPTHDGLYWATAFLHPQDAVDVASNGTEVRVAEGTYVRRAGLDTVVLTMRDGVAIYGGYAGFGEPDPDDRDPEAHVTTLDGETVAYHVVVGASNATLDGFTVTAGNAAPPEDYGGGMHNEDVTGLKVADCAFLGNTADYGGGISNRSSRLIVTNCTFQGNLATFSGGGMYNVWSSRPIVLNCTFSGNTAYFGGGVCNSGCSATVMNCILWGDSASDGPEICTSASDFCSVSYSDVEGGHVGTGNIDADPRFVDAAAGDLRLRAGSPCIDAADGAAAPELDKEANPRDDDLETPDTGIGTPTCVDMGAYEFQTGNPWSPPVTPFGGGCGAVAGVAALVLLAVRRRRARRGLEAGAEKL